MSKDACAICFEKIKEVDVNEQAVLSCGHEFHPACILKWFTRNVSCPTCRKRHLESVSEESPFQSFSMNLRNNNGRRVRGIIFDDNEESSENLPPLNLTRHFSISSEFSSLTWPEVSSEGYSSPPLSNTDPSFLFNLSNSNRFTSEMLYTLLISPGNISDDSNDYIPEAT